MQTTVTTLGNGLRVVTASMPVASCAIGIFVDVGARDEQPAAAGASHFLEHLLFKGTEQRSARSIAESLDAVGGDGNAFTTKEYTAFYARLLAEDAPLALEILGDIVTEPALRKTDVDAERLVIAEELAMHGDEPTDVVAETAATLLYPNHGLGRDTLGTATTIATLSSGDLHAFFDEHYGPTQMVVAIAGGGDHDRLLDELAARSFARPGARAPRVSPEAPTDVVAHRSVPAEQLHLCLAFRSIGLAHEQRTAAAVYTHLFGGGLSSRLFQRVREAEGLAYAVWAEREVYDGAGALTVNAGTSPDRARRVLEICFEELDTLVERGPTERELAIAKGNLRAELLMSLEDSGSVLSFAATELLRLGTVRDVGELVARIDAVDVEAVRTYAASVASTQPVLATVGRRAPKGLASLVERRGGSPMPAGVAG